MNAQRREPQLVSVREVMFSLVLPAVFAALMVTAARWSRRGAAYWMCAAVLGGYLIAHTGLFGLPSWPPSPARHGVVFAGIVGLLGGALIGAMRSKQWGTWGVRAAGIAAGLALVGWRRFANERPWSAEEIGAWGAMGAAAVAMWWILDVLARPRRRESGEAGVNSGSRNAADGWLAAAAVVGSSAPLVVIVGAAMGEGQALGALTVALMVCALGALTSGGTRIGSMGVGATAMIASTMWMSTVIWAGLPWWMAVGLCVAPFAALIGDAPWLRQRRAWVRSVVRVLAVSAVVAAVGGPSAVHELMTHSEEYGM